MAIILERLFVDPRTINNVDFNVLKEYLSFQNLFLPLLLMVIMRALKMSNLFTIGVPLVLFLYLADRNLIIEEAKLDFLNSMIYNDESDYYDKKSYLSMDPKIIDFYYNLKDYIDFNLSAYRKSLESTNNLLNIEYDMQNFIRYPAQLFDTALLEYKEALNNLQSVIYKLPSNIVSNERFNDSLLQLKQLLNVHLNKLSTIISNDDKEYGFTMYSSPTPFKLVSDLHDRLYSPHYSFF